MIHPSPIRARRSARHSLNYIGLDARSLHVNGRRLAMAPGHDQARGRQPRELPGCSRGFPPERVATAFRLVPRTQMSKPVLGISSPAFNRCMGRQASSTRCAKPTSSVPLIVRLAGTKCRAGNKIIKESGIPIITAQ